MCQSSRQVRLLCLHTDGNHDGDAPPLHSPACSRGEGNTRLEKRGIERATWTPSVSAKVNISDIPPGTLACRGQRSQWQTSDPEALRGQERCLWNLSAGGQRTQRHIHQSRSCEWKDGGLQEPGCDTKPAAPQGQKEAGSSSLSLQTEVRPWYSSHISTYQVQQLPVTQDKLYSLRNTTLKVKSDVENE